MFPWQPQYRKITLLTDFGSQDSYVGIMKGVIAHINPALITIDLTHEIPPQDRVATRFNLLSAVPYFPPDTVHLVVVDPGVGGQRRAIALSTEFGFLVGPDNGIFSGVLDQSSTVQAVELTNPQYWRTLTPSRTFHGRDIFATVAAHLASGVPLEQLGTPISAATLVQLPITPVEVTSHRITGQIQYIDRFGNLITNIAANILENKTGSVQVAGQTIPCHLSYSDQAPGELLALIGSHGYLEIAMNCGNAQQHLKLDLEQVITVLLDQIN